MNMSISQLLSLASIRLTLTLHVADGLNGAQVKFSVIFLIYFLKNIFIFLLTYALAMLTLLALELIVYINLYNKLYTICVKSALCCYV